jgi:hypothetical protein
MGLMSFLVSKHVWVIETKKFSIHDNYTFLTLKHILNLTTQMIHLLYNIIELCE